MATETHTGRQQGNHEEANKREQKSPQGTFSGSGSPGSGSMSNPGQQSQKFAQRATERSAGTGNEGNRTGSFSNNSDPSDRNGNKEGNNPARMQSPSSLQVGKSNEQRNDPKHEVRHRFGRHLFRAIPQCGP